MYGRRDRARHSDNLDRSDVNDGFLSYIQTRDAW
jgi:hypothetical protein